MFAQATAISNRDCQPCILLASYSDTMNALTCKPVTPCNFDREYMLTEANLTDDRVCMDLEVCNEPEEYESTPKTHTSDRECSTTTICTPLEHEIHAWSPTENRQCKETTQCDLSETYISVESTTTSDRECTNLTVCDSDVPFVDVYGQNFGNSVQYMDVPETKYSNRHCAPLTLCALGSQYQSVPPTATSDRNCSDYSPLCAPGFVQVQEPGDTQDRVCIFIGAQEDDTSSSGGGASGAAIGGAVAGVALLALVALFVSKRTKKKEDREDPERPSSMMGGASNGNPIYGGGYAHGGANKYLPSQRRIKLSPNDPMVAQFKRVTSFDHLRYNHRCLSLNDEERGKVYRVLGLAPPRRDLVRPLHDITRSFLNKRVTPKDDQAINDAVDFILQALPDVLTESGIDYVVAQVQGQDPSTIYESYYATIEDDCYAMPSVANNYASVGDPTYDAARFMSEGNGGHYEYSENGRSGRYDVANPRGDRVVQVNKRATYFEDPSYDSAVPYRPEEEYSTANHSEETYYSRGGGGHDPYYTRGNEYSQGTDDTYDSPEVVGQRARLNDQTYMHAGASETSPYDQADDTTYSDARYSSGQELYSKSPQNYTMGEEMYSKPPQNYALGEEMYSKPQRRVESHYDLGSS